MYQYHADGTLPQGDEIFVFGSNEAGRHGAGAAKQAISFGAIYGCGYGLQGRSYAIPTKDENIRVLPLSEIEDYVNIFLAEAWISLGKTKYFMTRIGCGLAGYTDDQIAPLFRCAPTNINFPQNWKPYLED